MSNLLKVKSQLVNCILRFQSQSPSRSCPHCGFNQGSLLPVGARRSYASSSPMKVPVSVVKKTKKKKTKQSINTYTEVIEVNKDLSISESTKSLSKLKPKDVTNCLESFPKPTSPIKRMSLPFTDQPVSPSIMLAMNYATSSSSSTCSESFAKFSAVPSSYNRMDHFQDLSLSSSSSRNSHLVPDELLQSLSSPNEVEEEHFFINPAPVSITIPSEKDLIDTEIDFDLSAASSLKTDVAPNDPIASEPLEESVYIPKTKNNSNNSTKVIVKKKYNTNRNLKKDEREKAAKVRGEELERFGRQVSMNKSLVAYLEMCVFTGQLNRGLNTLNFYRNRNKVFSHFPKVTDINAFNCILGGFAAKGNISKIREIFKLIQEDDLSATPQSYAALLECLGRNPLSKNNIHLIRQSIKNLEKEGYDLQDLFNKTTFEADQREIVLQAIQRAIPSFNPVIKLPFIGYACPLLTHLNEAGDHKVVSQAEGIISQEKLHQMAKKQLKTELNGTITVKSIEKKDNLENLTHYRKLAQETEANWSIAIEEALQRNMNTLYNQGTKHKSQRVISLYPFLKVLPPSDYVRIIIQEIRKLAEGSETYSPGVSQLYRELGNRVLARYQVLYKDEKGILLKVEELYNKYIKWYLHPSENQGTEAFLPLNSRQKWQELLFHPDSTGPHVDIPEKVWPNSVLSSIGRFLYGIIMRDIKINANVMKMNSKSQQMVPAFYSIFRMQGMHLKEEIKPHPALVKLFQAASRDELTFDATLVPMVCPPLPWASIRTGGYLLSPARIVRLPFQAHQQKLRLESCPPEDLYPSLDSLNQLSVIPWKINHKVLDLVIHIFNNKGSDTLGVSPPPSECPSAPPIDANMTKQEKFKVHKQRLILKRKRAEMYSLWCDCLYRLSLANHFRNDIFWLPHNMDFRGRVYPCPPHLNHLGADVSRSILVFALGKPLGPTGLDWLKLHLVNLTGLKKRDSLEDRLDFANSILDDILDSAENPLTGRKWWAESEEPWQTLACCIEIANAIQSGDPPSYVSHFPIHQDGSCNGLQHYAALGRDQAGAESVNLAPSDYPQDVYSSVATLVEKLRDRDARNGVKIAQVLEGFIKRKVIKQTVMTTVYGVTRYGARLQIAKQLKDIPDFPKEHLWPASLYLVSRTFDSLREMFTSTKLIQDWFTECARLISQVCGQNVEWVTPLGLPVVQPYFRTSKKIIDNHDPLRLPEVHIFDLFERPNVMKQKNAFPPNFIHSLDSSHMMLTSLHCERAGITFVSVHDCYWTHPCNVKIMNQICREQFVTLHSQPILEDLSKFLVEKYSYKESEFFQDGSVVDLSKRRLNGILQELPKTGSFDLKSVEESIYFFS